MLATNQKPTRAKTRSESSIVVMPSAADYADQMEKLIAVTYGIPLDQSAYGISAEKFRNHIAVFPEGQFIAVDTATDQVVGVTASMRFQFDPRFPLLTRWAETTNYG